MTPCVSVVACVGLMECPKQKPPVGHDGQTDLLNTYKKSIHNLKFSPSMLLLFFFKHPVLSMNIQHGQDLRHKDRSCPWETTRRKWREKQGDECMERAGTGKAESFPKALKKYFFVKLYTCQANLRGSEVYTFLELMYMHVHTHTCRHTRLQACLCCLCLG